VKHIFVTGASKEMTTIHSYEATQSKFNPSREYRLNEEAIEAVSSIQSLQTSLQLNEMEELAPLNIRSLKGLLLVNKDTDSLHKAKSFLEKYFPFISESIFICTDPVEAIVCIEDDQLDVLIIEDRLELLDPHSLLQFIQMEVTACKNTTTILI